MRGRFYLKDFFMNLKQPTTYEQQVQLLKGKGFIIQNDEYVINFLKTTNYYCFSAYLLPYKISNSPDKYKQGIDISSPILAYMFDKQISALLYETIGDIESHLRTLFAYELSHKYGPECYYDRSIFKLRMSQADYNNYIKKVKEAIRNNARTPTVKHHENKYSGKFPFWVIVEFLSLGTLTKFYADLTSQNQKLLSNKGFQIMPNQMTSWAKCLTDLRNRIAHYSRLYYWRFLSIPANPVNTKHKYKMDDTLFSQIYMLKQLYVDKEHWNRHIVGRIKVILDLFSDTDVIKHIKFPPNWEDLLTN